MQKIPECRFMNFQFEGMLNRYKDSEDIRKSYESRGLNGLEVIRAGEPDEGKILPDMVNGVHLYFHIFWMDWWKGNYERLDQEFDSREQWLEYFEGMSRESYLNSLRDDLSYAEQVGAKYVVFHVSEVTLRESYIYKYRYTDKEVIDASLEVINTLLDEKEYPFDFLVENLYGDTILENVHLPATIENGYTQKKNPYSILGII